MLALRKTKTNKLDWVPQMAQLPRREMADVGAGIDQSDCEGEVVLDECAFHGTTAPVCDVGSVAGRQQRLHLRGVA